MNANRSLWTAPLLAVALLLGASGGAGAQGTDSRWLPWLGCWEAEGAATGSVLCIVPSATDAGVEMVSVDRGSVVSRETVRADGTQRQSSREGCTGSEQARFSDDQKRIYLDANHVCEGNVRQQTTGMLALLSTTEWIDVRGVQVGEDVATGVSRYRLAPVDVADAAGFGNIAADRAMAVRAARTNAAARLGANDVIDASRNVNQQVVGAWIAERREPFRLDASQLVLMADQGVSPDVIDVMVAVSYPRRFTIGEGAEVAAVETQRNLASARVPVGFGGASRVRRFFDPFYGYGRYPYSSRYDSYPYGYGYPYDYFDYYGYGGFRPTVVVVQPRQEPEGRVVNGRGYTRTRSTGSSGSGSSGGSSSPAPAPASSSEPSSEPSGGSGGSSTGRTAMPRPPGG